MKRSVITVLFIRFNAEIALITFFLYLKQRSKQWGLSGRHNSVSRLETCGGGKSIVGVTKMTALKVKWFCLQIRPNSKLSYQRNLRQKSAPEVGAGNQHRKLAPEVGTGSQHRKLVPEVGGVSWWCTGSLHRKSAPEADWPVGGVGGDCVGESVEAHPLTNQRSMWGISANQRA